MLERNTLPSVIRGLSRQAAVVLLGPRQVGKTTLALEVAKTQPSVYLDLARISHQGGWRHFCLLFISI